jgi:hypothetical protein
MITHHQHQRLAATTPWVANTPAAAIAGIAALLSGIPALPDASCRGIPKTFDLGAADDPARVEQAKAICRSCPALERCRDWIDRTPPSLRPSGVVAGRLVAPPRVRKVQQPPQSRPRKPPRPTMADRATEWLWRYLADAGGSAEADAVKQAAAGDGYRPGTLYVAVQRLGVVSTRSGHRTKTWALRAGCAETEPERAVDDETAGADREARPA